eukprot:TRINITY_DN2819_c1_g1_i1.p1 TRINITY_DN2819_c1_g1~~TRINITY_DN2819_c1_g1_i1.p1  ORF type:complete len:182 (-),score=29.93 TRINITY_DN2819_c1_g1_i1:251-796(-)
MLAMTLLCAWLYERHGDEEEWRNMLRFRFWVGKSDAQQILEQSGPEVVDDCVVFPIIQRHVERLSQHYVGVDFTVAQPLPFDMISAAEQGGWMEEDLPEEERRTRQASFEAVRQWGVGNETVVWCNGDPRWEAVENEEEKGAAIRGCEVQVSEWGGKGIGKGVVADGDTAGSGGVFGTMEE